MYYELKATVKRIKNNQEYSQNSTLMFALPPEIYFAGVMPNPANKSMLNLDFVPTKKIHLNEVTVAVSDNSNLKLTTNLDITYYTGYSFRFRARESCSCEGYYFINFELVKVLSEEEYN